MKKSLNLFIFMFVFLFVFVVKVDAATLNVMNEDQLKDCIDSAGLTLETRNICNLSSDIELKSTLNITGGRYVEIVLGEGLGANRILEATGYAVDPLFYVNNGVLIVTGPGGIFSTKDAFFVQGNSVATSTDIIKSELIIGEDVQVVSEESNCIYIRGKGAKADVYGNLTSNSVEFSVIQGNGIKNSTTDNGGTEINIYAPANIISTYAGTTNLGIYHPQSGTLNVYGGTIKGVTGIEMRAGVLNIEGGTIIGTAATTESVSNGDGPSVKGAGVAIAQHTTIQQIVAKISNGTIQGATALYESTPENPSDSEIVNLDVSGGNFIADNNGEAIYSKNKEKFVSGGTFNSTVTNNYLATDAKLETNTDGTVVAKVPYSLIVATTENGKVTVADSAYEGDLVKINIEPNEGYKVSKIVVMDIDDKELTVTDNSFTMPKYDAYIEVTFEKIVANPNTGDGITMFIILGIISLGIASVSINKFRKNI